MSHLLAALPERVAGQLRDRAVRSRWRAHDTVVNQGDPNTSVYLVERGHVLVKVAVPSGQSVTVALLGPGDLFGELAAVTGAMSRTASVVALDDVTTLALPGTEFDRLRREHPAIDRALVEALALRVTDLSERITQAVYESADRRCVRRLLDAATRFGQGATAVTLPITQEDLAGMAGLSRPTTNQVLQKLVERGAVRVGRGWIEIPDISALRPAAR